MIGIRNIFGRNGYRLWVIGYRRKSLTVNPEPLTIQGIAPAPMTPEPDEAEKAAEAFLASLEAKNEKGCQPEKGTPAYYRQLADRIAAAHEAERRAAMRYVAYCEQELRTPRPPLGGGGDVAEKETPPKGGLWGLEQGLYRHLDTIDRDGGELKRRWQHCLAEVTVRLMNNPLPASPGGGENGGSAGGAENPANSGHGNPANSEHANPANSEGQNHAPNDQTNKRQNNQQ